MNFEKAALIISGLNIGAIGYQLVSQVNRPPYNVRKFEKYLLDKPHSFEREDVKGIVGKFNLSKYFSESLIVHFFPEKDILIAISPSDNGKRYFSLEIWDCTVEDFDDGHSWEIKVGDNDDILVEALKYICTVAKTIHNGKLQGFISKMDMFSE